MMSLKIYFRNKKKLRKEIQRYFEGDVKLSMSQSSSDTEQFYLEDSNQYATIGTKRANSFSPSERSRSPTDPLPDPEDIPGYLKTDFQRYQIYNPNRIKKYDM